MDETESPPSSSSDTLPSRTDAVVAALANRQRRAVLTHLQQTQPGTATVGELAPFTAEHDDGQSSTRLGDTGQNTTISRHHAHLPKLADATLITYDPDRGRVSDQSDGWVADLLAPIEHE